MFGRSDDSQPGIQAPPDGYAAPDPSTAPVPEPTPAAPLGDTPAADPTVVTPTAPPAPTPSPAHLNVPEPSVDTTAAASDTPASPPAVPDELLTIKQGALQDLSPLIDHLDQTPDERFRTTMMLIQATDDHTKLKEAYETAKQITDEKIRAQALLDVVNEINYFTQQHSKQK